MKNRKPGSKNNLLIRTLKQQSTSILNPYYTANKLISIILQYFNRNTR